VFAAALNAGVHRGQSIVGVADPETVSTSESDETDSGSAGTQLEEGYPRRANTADLTSGAYVAKIFDGTGRHAIEVAELTFQHDFCCACLSVLSLPLPFSLAAHGCPIDWQ
jgi:hypothetical protein